MRFSDVTQIFLSHGWGVTRIDNEIVRYTYLRRLAPSVYRRIVIIFVSLFVVAMLAWLGRNIVTISYDDLVASWSSVTHIERTGADYIIRFADGAEALYTERTGTDLIDRLSAAGLSLDQREYVERESGRRSTLFGRMLMGVLFAVGLALAMGTTLLMFWREADDINLLITRDDDGSFRVSRLGSRTSIREPEEVQALAQVAGGLNRRVIVRRWFTVSAIMTGCAIGITLVATLLFS